MIQLGDCSLRMELSLGSCLEIRVQQVETELFKIFFDKSEVRVIVGSQAAGGIGISLIPASHAIYYSRSFSLEHDVQSEARKLSRRLGDS
jgi:hypothetical protein